jgi:uncharacterized protein (TIGR04255 family)
MNVYPKLLKPPIEEAFISVSLAGSAPLSEEELDDVCQKLSNDYPKRSRSVSRDIAVHPDQQGIGFQVNQQQGHVLSADEDSFDKTTRLLHIHPNTLALHHIKPYESWERLIGDYQTAWEIFIKNRDLKHVQHIIIGYLNRFTLDIKNWDQILKAYPLIETRDFKGDFQMEVAMADSQYALRSKKYDAEAFVQLRINPENDDKLRVELDIQTIPNGKDYPYNHFTDLKNILERLRALKNDIFFLNIQNAEEIFQ